MDIMTYIFELFTVMIKLFIVKLRLLFVETKLEIKSKIFDFCTGRKRGPELKLSTDVNNALIETTYPSWVGQYFTSVTHPAFDEGCFLIVEEYENEIDAKTGHEKWGKTFEKWLPYELKDVATNKVYKRGFVDYCEDCFEEDFD